MIHKRLVHINLSDLHINVGVLSPEELAGNILFKIIDKIKFRDDIDLITLCGDTFHKPTNMDVDPYVEIFNTFLSTLIRYAKINEFLVVVIDGTKSHEQGMLEKLELIHTKKKDLLNNNEEIINSISKLSKGILDKIVYNGIDTTKDMFLELLNNIEDVDSPEYPVIFVKDVLNLVINDVNICCMSEQYVTKYETVLEKIPENTDVLVYHGMLEGAIPIIDKLDESDKMLHRYNKSHILRLEDLVPKIGNYCVAGHIHTRTEIYNKDDKKIWYTGSTFSHNFSDAGQEKGYDEIHLMTDNSVRVTFHKTINDKLFKIIDMTDDVNNMGINELIAKINTLALNNRKVRYRIDVRIDDVDKDNSSLLVLRDNLPSNVNLKIVQKKVSEEEETKRKELADMVKSSHPLELISRISKVDMEVVRDILDIKDEE